MDDYIFLIIAVGLSIYAAINKSKKEKNAAKSAPAAASETEEMEEEVEERNVRNYFMEQLLGKDFLDEPREMKPKPMKIPPIPERGDLKSRLDMNNKGIFKSRFVSTLPDRVKRPSISTMNIQEEEEEVLPDESVSYSDDFSLRKAVVYSQILERKYTEY